MHRLALLLCSVALLGGCSLTDEACPPAGDFSEFSEGELWACIQNVDGQVIIGVKNPGDESGVVMGVVLVSEEDQEAYFAALGEIEGVEIQSGFSSIPATTAEIQTIQAFTRVRSRPYLDYVEPNGRVGTE